MLTTRSGLAQIVVTGWAHLGICTRITCVCPRQHLCKPFLLLWPQQGRRLAQTTPETPQAMPFDSPRKEGFRRKVKGIPLTSASPQGRADQAKYALSSTLFTIYVFFRLTYSLDNRYMSNFAALQELQRVASTCPVCGHLESLLRSQYHQARVCSELHWKCQRSACSAPKKCASDAPCQTQMSSGGTPSTVCAQQYYWLVPGQVTDMPQ